MPLYLGVSSPMESQRYSQSIHDTSLIVNSSKRQNVQKNKTSTNQIAIFQKSNIFIQIFPSISYDSIYLLLSFFLQINSCSLRRLSPQILSLDQIQILDLSSNNLTSLPEQISNLKHLSILSLVGNKFVNFPTILCKGQVTKSLVDLDFRLNNLQRIPLDIERVQYTILLSYLRCV